MNRGFRKTFECAVTEKIPHFYFTGGALCLDFANSLSWRSGESPNERLQTYRDLLRFAEAANLRPPVEVNFLIKQAKQDSGVTMRAFKQAIQLREAVYRAFSHCAQGRLPETADIAYINQAFKTAISKKSLRREARSFVLDWSENKEDPNSVWWPLAESAVMTLTQLDRLKVRLCGADDCGWIFIDTSRNGVRRWCDMRVCGNRAKVRRYQATKKI